MIWAIVWAAVIVIEAVVISAPFYVMGRRWRKRDQEWRESPRAIPYRDLRQEYRQEP